MKATESKSTTSQPHLSLKGAAGRDFFAKEGRDGILESENVFFPKSGSDSKYNGGAFFTKAPSFGAIQPKQDLALKEKAPEEESKEVQNENGPQLSTAIGQLTGENIQRAPGDFRVGDLPPGHENRKSRIYFQVGQNAIPAEEQPKITEFVTLEKAKPTPENLELVGMASEEGPSALNQNLARTRARTVKTALETEGYPATITIRAITGEQANRVDYAETRSVELLRPGATSSAGNANRVVDCATKHAANYPARFESLLADAKAMVTVAATGLSGARTATTDALLNKYFGSATQATADDLLNRLTGGDGVHPQLDIYKDPGNHRCLEACVNAVASNSGRGTGAMLTICPALFDAGRPEREVLRTLIHEAAHAAPDVAARDFGYRFTRMIPDITTALGLQNSDSIALFVQEMNGLTPLFFGKTIPDTFTGFSGGAGGAAEQREVETALAFMELYIIRDGQLIKQMYSQYRKSQRNGTPIPAGFFQDMLDSLGSHFGFTSASVVPGESVTRKIAAIYDRVIRMQSALLRRVRNAAGDIEDVPLNVERETTTTSWTAEADSPGMGVKVGSDFRAQSGSPVAQLKVLLRALVLATPDISAGLVDHYVEMLDELRILEGLPDPQLR